MKVINRIKKYREFKEIINLKHSKRNSLYTIYYRVNDYNLTRIGILVTKKNGISVTRNKIKRQVRNILVQSIDFKKNLDLVIIISKNYDINEYKRNEEELKSLLNCLF